MSLEEFLADPYMDEISGSDFKTIARAMVQPAYQGWQFGGNPKLFPYDGSKEAGIASKEACAEYCQGDNSYPQAGLLTTIYRDDMPGHPKGGVGDTWYDFVPVFHSRDKYTGQVDVSGEFPYDLVMEGLRNNPSVFNKTQWCELSQPVDNVREPKRDKEASKYARRIYVVECIFESKETAYDAAGVNADNGEDDFVDFGGETKGLSDLAINGGAEWTVEKLKEQKAIIWKQIDDATKGIKTPGSKKMTRTEAMKFVCGNMMLDVSDLDIIPPEEIAF